jgi:hypothetical protein
MAPTAGSGLIPRLEDASLQLDEEAALRAEVRQARPRAALGLRQLPTLQRCFSVDFDLIRATSKAA